MPQVSRAQTAVWRFQSAWPSRDIFHEFAVDYAKTVEEMTGGRLKFDVVAAGSVVPAFQMQDAVHAGILDGGHGVCDIWYRKHKAASLFGSPPPFGWDAHGMLAWFYAGGGEALYRELVNDILKLNVVGSALFPDAGAAARLVQEGDQERRRPQGHQLPGRRAGGRSVSRRSARR